MSTEARFLGPWALGLVACPFGCEVPLARRAGTLARSSTGEADLMLHSLALGLGFVNIRV